MPLDLIWIPVGAEHLALWHRPRRQYLRDIAAQDTSAGLVVVTLLHPGEGAEHLGGLIQAAGLAWFWLPLSSGRPPEGAESDRIVAALPVLSAHLDAGRALLLHCSAGMHRTGMVAYALLRWRGYTAEQALAAIAQSRPITREALTPERLAWGERVVGASVEGEEVVNG
ncbi:MAG TPA: tyrosine-protein phosphatase [Anaerolineae bacterium]|nr:tyrosine-protein phosphatase [Anaerolineae bacterium]HQK15209.1 tyrosine-protein phosphatase [Anaerolineae bacterium]